ncbi:MAG: hypothetical protein K0B02_02060 [DPANN group archaeon]|nr:hypothetical protein [DPANN group archaeon]
MISEETLDNLKAIGLNLYERKIYAALIAKGVGSAGSLAEIAQVPRSRAYDVLESLAEKGFIVVQHTKPIKYVAIKPSTAMDNTKSILKKNFTTNVKRIDTFSDSKALNELDHLYTNGVSLVNPADLTGTFKGSYSIELQQNAMFKKATSTIDIMTSEHGIKNLIEAHSSILQKAKNRGINIRIAAPITETNKKYTDMLKDIATVKDLNDIKNNIPIGKMIIVDNKQAILGLTNEKDTHPTQQVSLWTASDHFTSNFAHNTFNIIWKNLE